MNATTLAGLAPSGRATTLESFGRLMQALSAGNAPPKELPVKLAPTDVVITPFGKSGTTWLQQMAHALRTRGDMDFDDISRVVPWLETAAALGLDLNAPQKANPRLFKSHLDAERIPPGGRYIIACRDPQDALYSMYRFMEGWFIEPGTVSLDDFARGTFIAAGSPGSSGGNYWTHLRSWWIRRNDPDVLFLAYEHMKNDLEGTVRKVASFMDITLDDKLLAIVMEHSSLEFMQQHHDRFDDKLMRELSVRAAGLPADSDSAKVRSGKVGESRQQLGPGLVAELDALWEQHITAELGFKNYPALIAALD